MERLLTIADAAASLSIAEITLRTWVAKRKVLSVKVGKCVRIPESELTRIVKTGTRPASS